MMTKKDGTKYFFYKKRINVWRTIVTLLVNILMSNEAVVFWDIYKREGLSPT